MLYKANSCLAVLASLGALGMAVSSAQSPEAPLLRQSLRFAGREWLVKDSGDRRVGPGPNWFGAANVWVDGDGRLHLRATERDSGCMGAEVVAAQSLGYGTYRFSVASNLDELSKNLILGLFTWDDTSSESFHRELDVEIGRWGKAENDDAQFVVQPHSIPRNIVRFKLPRSLAGTVHTLVWMPGKATFRTTAIKAAEGAAAIREHTFHRMVPEPGNEQARINLWCADSDAPAPGRSEVILSDFRFTPLQ